MNDRYARKRENQAVGNSDIEAARTYHEITKHSYTSVRAGAYPLDWDNRPGPYKIYPEAGTMALPESLQETFI